MAQASSERPSVVVGPLGEPLTLETLPPTDRPVQWIARRKAQVVAAVKGGLLTVEEACERYQISLEEFAAWNQAVEKSGILGLRTTHRQSYKKLWNKEERDAEKVRDMTRR
jgi:transposase